MDDFCFAFVVSSERFELRNKWTYIYYDSLQFVSKIKEKAKVFRVIL